jgi:hypothetical protein
VPSALARAGVNPFDATTSRPTAAVLREEEMLHTAARRSGPVAHRRRLVLTFALMAVAAAALPPATAAETVALSIDVSRPGAKIDRNIFGQFAEHLGHGIHEGVP